MRRNMGHTVAKTALLTRSTGTVVRAALTLLSGEISESQCETFQVLYTQRHDASVDFWYQTPMRLVLANLNYSSWSMRAWLALRLAELPFKTFDVAMKSQPDWKERILQFSGAGKVPVLVDGALTIHESLAICEYVHELRPAARLWPEDRALRARGRAISCEMLSSFSTLRSLMPCNVRGRSLRTPTSPALDRDLARIFDIWEASLATSPGPYLLSDHLSIADCMYAPVLFRFRTYGVALSDTVRSYSDAVLSHPHLVELQHIAASTDPIAEYDAALQ